MAMLTEKPKWSATARSMSSSPGVPACAMPLQQGSQEGQAVAEDCRANASSRRAGHASANDSSSRPANSITGLLPPEMPPPPEVRLPVIPQEAAVLLGVVGRVTHPQRSQRGPKHRRAPQRQRQRIKQRVGGCKQRAGSRGTEGEQGHTLGKPGGAAAALGDSAPAAEACQLEAVFPTHLRSP